MNFRLIAVTLIIASALTAAAFAQGIAVGTPVNVIANLKVSDSGRKPVSGLKKADIKVFENGIEQNILYFAEKSPDLHIGFVVDNSGSLRGQLERVIDIGKFITSNLSENDEAFVVRFVSRDKVTLVQSWTSNKDLLDKSFDDLFIDGGLSAVVDGLYLAQDKVSQRSKEFKSGRYALVLISDCEDRDSFYSLKQLISSLRPTNIQVFVVSLAPRLSSEVGFLRADTAARKRAENFADTLSLMTGGIVIAPFDEERRKQPLIQSLRPLFEELQANYVISYTSSNPQWDGKTRSLRVEVADDEKGAKRQVIARESFVVPTK